MKLRLQDIEECSENSSDRNQRKPKKRKSRTSHTYLTQHGITDFSYNGTHVKVWAKNVQKDRDLVDSIKNLTKLPDVHPHIAIMPDYHKMGLFINGAIIPSRNTLYVQAIGGDIGCGFSLAKLPLKKNDLVDLKQVYKRMNSQVPSGRRSRSTIEERIDSHPIFDFESAIVNRTVLKRAKMQFGSVGDGNHFAELLEDDLGQVYSLVHTGSRGLGQTISKTFLKDSDVIKLPHDVHTIRADSPLGEGYLQHVDFAQQYSKSNREEIQRQIFLVLKETSPQLRDVTFDQIQREIEDLPHNTITRQKIFGEEAYVHRKGANHTPKNSFGIIAGSMGTPTFLVRGKGDEYSFDSCSHGAGRILSRGQARSKISKGELEKATRDVICRKDENVVDEAPQAYKDIKKIIKYQRNLVRIDTELNPFLNIRG